MITSQQIESAKKILLKYTLPDALKPEYDGMTAWELAKLMLESTEDTESTRDDGRRSGNKSEERKGRAH
jgi:hypothetical protein